MTLFENNIVIGPNNFSGILPVGKGGTGNSTFMAYSVICAGVTATDPFQNVVGVGTLDQILTSNGPGTLPTWQTPSTAIGHALTKTDDTNVTLTLTGTPATALLQDVNIAAGWTGTLGTTRGGTGLNSYTLGDTIYASAANTLLQLAGNTTSTKNFLTQTGTGVVSAAPSWGTISAADVPGSALTKTDDTNVTLTLGGTPTTALLHATSLTLGWTGTLGLTRGGTAASLTASNGGIVYSNASTLAILAGTSTANQVLLSGASTTPAWSTATYPPTTTINQILYSSAANTITGLATATTAVLTTVAGVPTWAAELSMALGGTNANLTASNGGIFYSTASAGAILSGTATAGLALLSGASTAPTWSNSPPITRVVKQIFTGNGTYTPTSGMVYCIIECVGGGGGGGGAANSGAAQQSLAGGGGGGGYSRLVATAATIGVSKAVTVGTGGAGGLNTGATGTAGNDTSVGTLCIGKGGSGGGGTATTFLGGAGGVAGTGDLTSVGGAGGGGAATAAAGATMCSGQGGSSVLGGGGLGHINTTAGGAGGAYGGGGGGAASNNAGGAVAGGAGADGVVFITEYIST
jgi:hypothetical protein